jgi:hypothetical protein
MSRVKTGMLAACYDFERAVLWSANRRGLYKPAARVAPGAAQVRSCCTPRWSDGLGPTGGATRKSRGGGRSTGARCGGS